MSDRNSEIFRIELRFDGSSRRQMRVFDALKNNLRKGDMVRLFVKLVEENFDLAQEMREQVINYVESSPVLPLPPPNSSVNSSVLTSPPHKKEVAPSPTLDATDSVENAPSGVKRKKSLMSGLTRQG